LFEGLPQIESVEWHDDTFDIPAGAVTLACSEGCSNQAFRFGEKAYGLQFHPEVSPAMLEKWIKADGDSTDRSNFQHAVEDKAKELEAQADRLMDNFIQACISRASR
jgi:GMP synthase-like glutamine amidotransferase